MDDKREEKLNNNNNSNSAQPVRSFGVQNMSSDGAEDIKERIDSSRKTNLNNDTKTTSKDIANELNTSTNSLPKKDGLEIQSPSNNSSSSGNDILNSSIPSEIDDESSNKLASLATAGKSIANAAKDLKKAPAKLKGIVAFFKTPVGHVVLIVGFALLGLVLVAMLATLVSTSFQLVISSIGMKFGLTGEYAYYSATEENEEYKYYYDNEDKIYREGMTRTEVEEMVKNAEERGIVCKRTFFTKVLNFLGFHDPTDPCQWMHYFKDRLEHYEGKTKPIAPGYIMNTFYYAFETQNYKLNGEPFITSYIKDGDSAQITDDESEIKEVTSDLDAINLLFGHKKADGTRIFYLDDINILLDEYIYQEHYKYWKWELVNEDPEEYKCVEHTAGPIYKIDVDKYKLFLRYGNYVSIGNDVKIEYDILKELPKMAKEGNRGYEADKNFIRSYEDTDAECRVGCTGCYEDTYGKPPSGMGIYETKAYPDVAGDDGAVINLTTGSYEYKDGFIFTRYPRYMPEFTVTEQVIFDFNVAKEIEKFIELISDRQDYGNYLLGYESDIGDMLGKKGNGTTSEIICDYTDLEGANIDDSNTDIQIQLTFPNKNSFAFDAFDFESDANMPGDTINLEKYVLGVVYAEAGGESYQSSKFVTSVETTSKAFAIMARSYLLSVGASNGSTITISNSTQKQTYCDPDEGCYRCRYSGNNENRDNTIIVPADYADAQNNSLCNYVPPLAEDSPLRQYVSATAGQVMTTSSGNVAMTGYNATKLNAWFTDQSLANYDYAEILYYLYGDQGFELNGVDCEVVTTGGGGTDIASGPWDSWKQCGPWGDQPFGRDGTLCRIGCLITSYSKLIADADPSALKIPNFNPQTFTQALNANNCFSGNDLLNYCALDTAVGTGNYTYNSGSLTGTFENKRSQVESFLNQGYYVIISVKNDGHWVYVTGTTANDILMSDPASSHGNSNSVFNTYGNTSISYKIIKFT